MSWRRSFPRVGVHPRPAAARVPETDLPGELKRREDRLARIRAAKAALEADARATRAAQLREQAERAREAAAACDDPAGRERAERRAERRDVAADALTAADDDEPSGSGSGSRGAPGELVPSNDAGPSTTGAAPAGGTADEVQAG
ncbi:MAG: hypothetical protein ABMA64_41970, partial [Myxococcota bacterium]